MWIVYCLSNGEQYRYIIFYGENDEAIKAMLRSDERIELKYPLADMFQGEVIIVGCYEI